MRSTLGVRLVAASMALGLLAAACGGTDDAAALEGEAVELITPYAPGGAYDRLLRVIDDYLGEASGANVVVMPEEGAGGLVAVNNLYASDGRDHRLVLANTAGALSAQLGEADGVDFELTDFHWIGSLTGDPELLVVAPDGRYSTLEEMLDNATPEDPVRFGASGVGDTFTVGAIMLETVFDLPVEIVMGFAGAPDVYAGIMRGDIDTALGTFSALPFIEDGDLAVAATLGDIPDDFGDWVEPQTEEAVTGATPIIEVARDRDVGDDGLELVESLLAGSSIDRSLIASPNTPPEVVDAYRDAFATIMEQDEMIREGREQFLFLNMRDGAEVEAIIDQIIADEVYVELMQRAHAQ